MAYFFMLMLLTPITCAADWSMFGHDPQHTGVTGESVYYLFEAMKNEN